MEPHIIENSFEKPEFQELTPVTCDKCGSAVPLASREIVSCIYCGASVQIPAEYQRSNQAKNQLEEIKKHAQKFLEKLGSKSKKWEIWLSLIPSWAFLLILLLGGTFCYDMIMKTFKYWLSLKLEVYYADYLSDSYTVPFDVGLFFVLLSLAMAAFFIVRRRVFVSRRLMTVLAAGMPVKPGGPATCRHCGALFMVNENELVAACDYCGTENFLQVPEEWLSKTRKVTSFSGRNVFWAEREFEREMTSSRLSLFNQLKLYGFCFAIFTAAFIQGDSTEIRLWKDHVARSERELFAIASDAPIPRTGEPFKMHGVYRMYTDGRQYKYKMALKKDEILKFSNVGTGTFSLSLRSQYQRESHKIEPAQSKEFRINLGGWTDLLITTYPENHQPTILIELNNLDSRRLPQ
ncbi:MAG TPA: hypothetical protein DCG57_03270 [Candidatus Riflebacteria bacterium]|jgi:predicted  nucleic acid-binding Zn-ribbon protein|nr:hypothetical protein [Candidatus Riflebacteria bacterium]